MEQNINTQHGQAEKLQSDAGQERKKKPLPSRSEMRRNKKKKNKWKMKFPLLKLLALFFILMPVSIYGLYTYFGQKPLSALGENGFETVEISGGTEEDGIPGTDEAKSPEDAQETKAQQTDSIAAGTQTHRDKQVQDSKEQEKGYKILYHTVEPEETIFDVSLKYYNSDDGVALIQKWNQLSGTGIEVGQVLKIPIKQ
ncbi:LysM peptidoglycan-binding domain-containing protein [Peribacillus cavernae]|uniref:LysM peptidoglycan-binding domain-containing protein n=1 Tax=Peribacillus cavernae TaxID=1674310 RepID=A0A3S0U370_9BACI|nr:LysM peptidoglycan-binding domain-containing protein [Peribacillus cavernae]MDQ0219020.1 LysM repeat protein [Peribacillus cavernae]RUQ29274.1 LysM peptidoglycan-binding domain-containing protein [Peribacillus cavernae]